VPRGHKCATKLLSVTSVPVFEMWKYGEFKRRYVCILELRNFVGQCPSDDPGCSFFFGWDSKRLD